MSKQFSKTDEKVPSAVLRDTTAAIAKELNEPAIERLRWIVAYLGPQVALEVLQETLDIEKQGGVLIQDGSRRRSPGGVFFSLVKKGVNKNDRRKLFPYTPSNQGKLWPKRGHYRSHASNHRKTSGREYRIRSKYQPEIKELLKSEEFGVAENMSVKLVGRPGKVVEKDSFVMTMIEWSSELPSISKDLPLMPQSNVRLLVYITKKQWNVVAPELKRSENSLTINGIMTYDENLRRMVVFARAVTVKVGQPSVVQELKTRSNTKKDSQDDVVSEPVEFSQAEDITAELRQTKANNNEAGAPMDTGNEAGAATSTDNEVSAPTDTSNEADAPTDTDNEADAAMSTDNEVSAPTDTDNEAAVATSTGNEADAAMSTDNEADAPTSTDNEADAPTDTDNEADAASKARSLEEEFAEDEPPETVQSDLEWE